MAGLTAAGALRANGWEVVLLDKGRGVGGRMATRRMGESRLDHGAQFFTVRHPRFQSAIDGWVAAGWVEPWFEEGGHVRYRGVGGMNALAKHLAKPFDVRTETKVERVEAVGGHWLIDGAFEADALLLTAPAPQSLAILGDAAPPEIAAALGSIEYEPCFALLLTLDGPSRVPAPGYVRPENGPIEWIADNTQKGLSTGGAALTVHARADFSREHLEASPECVQRMLLEAASEWFGGNVTGAQLHRWRYSRPVGSRDSCLSSNTPAPFAIAGDAFGGARIEGAYLSGLGAAAFFR